MSLQTSYGQLPERIGAHAEKKLLEVARTIIVLGLFGATKPMPKNKGQVIKFRRTVSLPPATTPLVEGVTPPPSAFRYEDVEASLSQFGDWVELTDVIADLHEDDVGKDIADVLGQQAAETIEQITYGVLKGGTNVILANRAGSRSDVASPLTLTEQRLAVRFLQAMRAKPITSVLAPTVMIGTKPVEGGYVALCHTDISSSIRNLPGFVSVAEYGSRKPICPEELGSVEDMRYIVSPMLKPIPDAGGAAGSDYLSTSGTNADVYPVIILGQNAFGHVPLKGSPTAGGAIKPMVRQPGTPDSNDPMGRSGSVAWKTWYTALILNQTWMIRLEVAAEANPA